MSPRWQVLVITSFDMNHNPEILCRNVHGLNSPAKWKAVKDFIATVKVNLVCLQETKLDIIDQFMVM